MVYYRKYRPQTIDQLDISSVRERLTSILKSGDIPHAFLFSGPKGLGKTSAARILAKAINCLKRNKESGIKNHGKIKKEKNHNSSFIIHDSSSIEPCNKCDVCKSITNGSNLDVLEIDAASNRGIDEIRDLREKIKFTPVSLHKKIYIIDEVHMLTTEAFNALLKTLEEPPDHALFVLCTTESWKLPDTIISRSFSVPFEKPTKEELKRSFDRILKGENLNIDEDAYDEICMLAQGSFRDGAKVIEELSLVANKGKITKEMLEKTFKTKSIDNEIFVMLNMLSDKNFQESLQAIERLANNGVDFATVIEKTVRYLHKLLLKRSGLNGDAHDIKGFTVGDIEGLIEEFSQAYKNLKFAVLPQLPLELVIIKWGLKAENKVPATTEDTESLETLRKKPATIESAENIEALKNDRAGKSSGPSAVAGNDILQKLIGEVQKTNPPLAGVLRGCNLISIKDNLLELEAAYKFHGDKLNEEKAKEIVRKAAVDILGKNVNLVVSIKKST